MPTGKPWLPEHIVMPDAAVRLIESQFPELRPAHIQLLGEGWDNTAYVVNRTWVFRFPRREIAVELLQTETRVLPRIAAQLPFPIPVPRWVGKPTQEYDWPFAGYRFLPGTTALSVGLTREQRKELAAPLANFLATLHAIDPGDLEIPGDKFGRADMGKRIPQLLSSLLTIRGKGLVADVSPWERIVEQMSSDFQPRLNTLSHDDFSAEHILVDNFGLPSGVIDWGDIHLGSPSMDLAIAFGFLPPEGREVFWDSYGAVEKPIQIMARFRALHAAVIGVLYGDDIGDTALLRESLLGMDFAIES